MSKLTLFKSLALALLFALNLVAQDALETTTFYIVRHADRDGSHDALNSTGYKRAQQLSQLMQHLRISEIYATETSRAQSTAKPTADLLELTIQPYAKLTPEWFDNLKSNHVGEAVLIVGHSNTSSQIAEGLGGQGDFAIEENEFDSLFVVTIDADGTKAVRLQYGEAFSENQAED